MIPKGLCPPCWLQFSIASECDPNLESALGVRDSDPPPVSTVVKRIAREFGAFTSIGHQCVICCKELVSLSFKGGKLSQTYDTEVKVDSVLHQGCYWEDGCFSGARICSSCLGRRHGSTLFCCLCDVVSETTQFDGRTPHATFGHPKTSEGCGLEIPPQGFSRKDGDESPRTWRARLTVKVNVAKGKLPWLRTDEEYQAAISYLVLYQRDGEGKDAPHQEAWNKMVECVDTQVRKVVLVVVLTVVLVRR